MTAMLNYIGLKKILWDVQENGEGEWGGSWGGGRGKCRYHCWRKCGHGSKLSNLMKLLYFLTKLQSTGSLMSNY